MLVELFYGFSMMEDAGVCIKQNQMLTILL